MDLQGPGLSVCQLDHNTVHYITIMYLFKTKTKTLVLKGDLDEFAKLCVVIKVCGKGQNSQPFCPRL